MSRRMKIMLIAVIVLFPFSIYRVYTSIWGKSRPRSASVAPPSRTIAPSPAAKERAAARGEVGGELREFQPIPVNTITFKEQLASGRWGRNPFLTPGEIRSPKKVLTKAPTVTGRAAAIPLAVTSVLISADGSVAVINGEFYTVGDTVPGTGKRIAAITPDGVVIGGADERQELIPLAQSKIRLKSREMQ